MPFTFVCLFVCSLAGLLACLLNVCCWRPKAYTFNVHIISLAYCALQWDNHRCSDHERLCSTKWKSPRRIYYRYRFVHGTAVKTNEMETEERNKESRFRFYRVEIALKLNRLRTRMTIRTCDRALDSTVVFYCNHDNWFPLCSGANY